MKTLYVQEAQRLESPRATGRTFRVLCKALYLASGGKKVLIEVADSNHAHYIRQRLNRMLEGLNVVSRESGSNTAAHVAFPNGGYIIIAACSRDIPRQDFGLRLHDAWAQKIMSSDGGSINPLEAGDDSEEETHS